MDLHDKQPVLRAGAALPEARAAMVLVHGRGATAVSILELAKAVHRPGFAYLAPQAAEFTWYPNSFMAPIASNEPWLSSALRKVGAVVEEIEGAGVAAERIILLGFSQGACLASEVAVRNARRYGGVVAFSGGVIGPDATPRDDAENV
ncbi:hypothetical protein BH23GEM3_BH23GEM3_25100 [soil metagenome]